MALYTTQIQKLYVAYFSRPADYFGLQYWEAAVAAANGSTEAVAAAFAASAEYQDEYGSVTYAVAVNTAYRNLFGHDADLPGLAFWTNGLTRGDFSLAQAVTAIAAGAQGSDLIAFNAKITAATAFTNALDTTQEILWYVGRDANRIGREFLSHVTDAVSLEEALHRLELYGPYEPGPEWPQPTPLPEPVMALYAGATSVNEGKDISFQLFDAAPDTTYHYTISGGVNAADLGSPLEGEFHTDGLGRAIILISTLADQLTEGAEQINLSIDGTALIASAIIDDTSLSPALESNPAQLIGVPWL